MDPKHPLTRMGHHAGKHTAGERELVEGFCRAFECSVVPLEQRLQDFPRHVRRQDVARFLTKYEIFKLALPANGSIVECGVFAGGGLMSWVHFSSIMEPYNHTRRVIGFDTFSGFPDLHNADTQTGVSDHLRPGGLDVGAAVKDELTALADLHDRNRPLGHIPKMELVMGDARTTIDAYVKAHPHLIVSLIYLDFDIYAPTKAALQHLYPRVVKGGVIAFDELNCPEFPGETTALLEALDLNQVELRRLPMDPYISYFIK